MAELGPFLLEDPVGRGGMGVVYRARHPDGTRVAIKVPTREGASTPQFVAAFHDEVRAIAALDHPAIVRVYDHGVVSAKTEEQTLGSLRAGAPWIAMEWASGGTLSERPPPETWDEVAAIVHTILGALAHVHARSIVHRDLKPENVLVCTDRDGSEGLRLSDFGFVLERGTAARLTGGTPAYMAPEQRWGIESAQGPWTDLYALGLVTWLLVAGSLPDPHDPQPAFEPELDVPEGLEHWLLGMLAQSPRDRFRRAPDAASALTSLPPLPPGERRSRTQQRISRENASTHFASSIPTTPKRHVRWSLPPAEPAALRIGPPPPPPSWRGAPATGIEDGGTIASRAAPIPANVGRGLVHLRPVPLVGRGAERDALWSALVDTHRAAAPRAVVLSGAAGVGKTRLLEWLLHRASELGVADPIWAVHRPDPDRGSGLVPMIARAIGTEGLEGEMLVTAIAMATTDLDTEEQRALAALLAGAPGREPARPRDRRALAARVLSALARQRPLAIGIDDAQWGDEALDLVRETLDREELGALLFVVAVRDDAIAERPAARERIDALLGHPHVRRLAIEALPADQHGDLVRRVLGLDASVALSIEERTRGNPGFAIELVMDCIGRGLLVPGPDGFRLEGDAPELPADLAATWRMRMQRVLATRSDDDVRAIEIAAVLGDAVDPAEWQRACRAAAVTPRDDLVDTLARERLVRRSLEEHWRFAHGMVREAMLAFASSESIQAHHAACVEALRPRIGELGRKDRFAGIGRFGPADDARLGRHLLHAGRPAEAVAPLLRAIDGLDDAGDYALEATTLADALVAIRALPEDAVDRGEVRVRQIGAEKHLGRLDHARRLGEALLEELPRRGWTKLATALHIQLADVHRLSGGSAAALAHCDEAERSARATGLPVPGILRRRAQALIDAGRLDEAGAALALVAADPDAPQSELAIARRLEGVALRLRGQPREAIRALEAALSLAAGLRWETAETLNALGDALRAAGDLEGADRRYGEALVRFRALASGDVPVVELNRALVLVARERWTDVRAVCDRLAVLFERNRRRPLLAAALAVGLPARAGLGEWEAFDAEVARVEELLAATGFVEKDLLYVFERAEVVCTAAGEPPRASRVAALAAGQRERLAR